ncbi:hypothetical protein [Nitrosopumilus sp.]|uniref:hypothetical protein n=1 Tax=Nitrosopumilus sp. TaxID=2024843 RepID=UPI0034A00D24
MRSQIVKFYRYLHTHTEQTSIAVSKESKEKWEKFKNHKHESFEAMINRILKSQFEEDAELLTDVDILEIEQSIKDIKKGKFKTLEQMKTKYSL